MELPEPLDTTSTFEAFGRRPLLLLRAMLAETSWAAYLPLIAVVVFNCVLLWPEVSVASPSLNDDAFHYSVVQRTSDVIAAGENPFDHWTPYLGMGFPEFTYYQHLPHLTVAVLHNLTGRLVSPLTVFNLVRFLLLVSFPVTVYWSTRTLGFTKQAAICAAAASSLLSGAWRYGFEYESYIWRGFGMYTQLWAMHLSFLALACVGSHLDTGRSRVRAVIVLSVLVLSHLIYAYMMVISLGIFILARGPKGLIERMRRLAIVGFVVGLVTSYMWLPFLRSSVLLNASPYLARDKYDSFGAHAILSWLVKGDLLDHARWPVLTVLLGLGVLYALVRRSQAAVLSLCLFGAWLLLYFGRPTWGSLVDLLPLHDGLLLHRFVGSMDIGAIMLIGLGGGAIWAVVARLLRASPVAASVAPAVVILVLLLPALREREHFYGENGLWLGQSRDFVAINTDARQIVDRLQTLPPGRVFAGLPAVWGDQMRIGFLSFSDLLVFNQVNVLAPSFDPSLNADLEWDFDYTNPSFYDLFNVHYVVAPATIPAQGFWRPLVATPRYVLYETQSTGYFDVGRTDTALGGPQQQYHGVARTWLHSGLPAAGEYPLIDLFRGKSNPLELEESDLSLETLASIKAPSDRPGYVVSEQASAARHSALVNLSEPGTVVLKATYHPDWRAFVDGKEAQTFMVLPSFTGVAVAPGVHRVRLEYAGDATKPWLILLGLASLACLVIVERRRRAVS